MLTKTSELAVQAILFLALRDNGSPYSPRQLSELLHCSPSYLAKTLNMLVRAGILRSVKGVNGGVLLARSPGEITLLEVVEASQGLVTANYCQEKDFPGDICSFHAAMKELHESVLSVLSKWRILDLLERPATVPSEGGLVCKMFFEGFNGPE